MPTWTCLALLWLQGVRAGQTDSHRSGLPEQSRALSLCGPPWVFWELVCSLPPVSMGGWGAVCTSEGLEGINMSVGRVLPSEDLQQEPSLLKHSWKEPACSRAGHTSSDPEPAEFQKQELPGLHLGPVFLPPHPAQRSGQFLNTEPGPHLWRCAPLSSCEFIHVDSATLGGP